MKTQAEIYQKIKTILLIIANVDEEDVQLASTFKDSIGLDSIDQAELMLECEIEFDIIIPDNEIEEVKTIEELIGYIQKKLKEKQ